MSLRIGDKVKTYDKNGPEEHGHIVDIKWNMIKVAFPNEHRWIDSRYVNHDSPSAPKT
jgi:hypothetical protein